MVPTNHMNSMHVSMQTNSCTHKINPGGTGLSVLQTNSSTEPKFPDRSLANMLTTHPVTTCYVFVFVYNNKFVCVCVCALHVYVRH